MESKEIKPVNPKRNQPEYSLEGLRLKLQFSGHLMGTASLLEKTLMLVTIEGKRRGWQRMSWLDSITDLMDMNLASSRREIREAWHATVLVITESWTQLSD